MSQQTYPVACACGITHQVTGGQAGSSFPCGCGRTVEVPTLGVLKRSVGQSAVSADWEIEHRLREGSLPAESDCVCCGMATDDTAPVQVVCERTEVQSPFKWWYWVFFPLGMWFLIGMVVAQLTGRERVEGRDVAFRLPVRVCAGCRVRVQSAEGSREALMKSDLYGRLLAKYPHAEVSPPG